MGTSYWNDRGSSSKKRSSVSNGGSPDQQLRNWLELPREVTLSIFSRLVSSEILKSTQFVCKSWFDILKDPLFWRKINMYNVGESCLTMELDRMCRHAVDRSSGGLIDINIEYFGNDDLLKYITDRCNQIKCLGLACCYNVSDAGLIEAITKLSILEELDISRCSRKTETLELVGRYCPRLRSLELNHRSPGTWLLFSDDEAFAIANYMPNLGHLKLRGNAMSNLGLQAILDGCSNLESLDLRGCRRIDLKGELGKRCREQIKYLQFPHESRDKFRIGRNHISSDSEGVADNFFFLSFYEGVVDNLISLVSDEFEIISGDEIKNQNVNI